MTGSLHLHLTPSTLSFRAFNARIARLCDTGEFHGAPGVKKFRRIMTKSAEYCIERHLKGWHARVMAPVR